MTPALAVRVFFCAVKKPAAKGNAMTDITNKTRARRAEDALRQYIEARGEVFEQSRSEIADLIADLLHLAVTDTYGDDETHQTLRLAMLHFDAEHGNAEEAA
jgi:hypothetical protein